MNYNRLIASLKFKHERNSTYFIVKSDFTDNSQNFKIYAGAMLLFSNIPTEDEDHLYLNIIYKIRPLNSEITISDEDEGLMKLKYSDLANLIIAKKIEAYYTDKNKIDKEIYNIIN